LRRGYAFFRHENKRSGVTKCFQYGGQSQHSWLAGAPAFWLWH
jgi:hypothetical protein